MTNNNKPWINENGIDFVEVNNIVNPPDKENAGKVVGIDENGRCKLIDVESGGEPPEVTDADDGKILTVQEGEWTVAEPSSESGYTSIEIHYKGDQITEILDVSNRYGVAPEITLRQLMSAGLQHTIYVNLVEYQTDGNAVVSRTDGTINWGEPPRAYTEATTPNNITFRLVDIRSIYGDNNMRVNFTIVVLHPHDNTIDVSQTQITAQPL